MPETTTVLAIVTAFIVGFPLFWMAIIFSISRLSGWASLANQYPAKGPIVGETFHWSSARFRFFSNYGNCLSVTVAPAGIHIQPIIFFKTGHAPILIPWQAIMELKSTNYWLSTSTLLSIRGRIEGWPSTITFYGKRLADSLQHHFKNR